MKKKKCFSYVLLGLLMLTGCTAPKDSETQKEESGTKETVVAMTEEKITSTEQSVPEMTVSSDTESDEKLAAEVDDLMTEFNLQKTEADALPYLQKIGDLVEKMQKPGLKTVIISMIQIIPVDATVNGLDTLDTNLNWAIGQLDRVAVEKVTATDLMTITMGIGHTLDIFQYLSNGPDKISSFMDKMNNCIEKIIASHQDSTELPIIQEEKSSFQCMAAWNAILCKDYKKADEYLVPVVKHYQNKQEEINALLNESNENAESESVTPNLGHFDFLRAFILFETNKKDEALSLFRHGIENDLKYTHGIFSKNLYYQLQSFEFQGHDVSELQPIREELEIRLKDIFEKGIEVTGCEEGSIAEKAGIKAGDRVVKYDGWYVCDMNEFTKRRWAENVQKTTKTVMITVMSNDESRDLEVPSGRLGIGVKDVE